MENRDRAERQIWICMVTLTVNLVYNDVYSIILKAWPGYSGCTSVFLNHRGLNNIIWFISRGMSDFFWLYPFLYLFWPKPVKMIAAKNEHFLGRSPSYSVDDYTEYVDSDDEVQSVYPSQGNKRSLLNQRSLVTSMSYSVHDPRRVNSIRVERSLVNE